MIRTVIHIAAHKDASDGQNNHYIVFRYTNSSTEIPEFPIPPEIALELLMAANFLDC